MQFSFNQKLFLFSIVILTGIGFTGYAVYKSNQKLTESAQWVEHTRQVIYESGNVLLLAKDIGAQDFVITNDSDFLAPLYKATASIFKNIHQLRALTKDNTAQQQRIDSLEWYVQRRIEFSQLVIGTRIEHGLDAALQLISAKKGKRYSDSIRYIVEELQQEESQLLLQRQQANEHSIATLNRVSSAMFLGMAGFTILLLVAIRSYIWQQQRHTLEMQQRSAELEQKIDELKKAKLKLTAVNKELEAFSYSVSHDLRAPLRAIHGFTRIISEDYAPQLDAEAKRMMNTIMFNAKKMSQLIDDLLNFSRLGRLELAQTTIATHELVTGVCEEVKVLHSQRQIEFNIQALPDVKADKMIRQVWENLISNAVKYTSRTPTAVIEIKAQQKGDEVIFSVQDNGAGFDMRYVDKLFGVFQRLHTEADFEGTGVGLATVQRIVSKHGGKVSAKGKVNEGATFNFSLPKT